MNGLMKYKLLRVKKGIKICDLKEHLGCSDALVSMYEHDKSGMSQERVQKYKEYIDNAEYKKNAITGKNEG